MPRSAVPTQERPKAPTPVARQSVQAAPDSGTGGLAGYASAPASVAPAQNVPQLGTFQAQNSKYYAGTVVDPVSGTHYDADTGKTADEAAQELRRRRKEPEVVLHWDDEKSTQTNVLARYVGVFAAVLVAAGIWAHITPQLYVLPLVIAQFVGALLMPVLGVAPWQDEDSDHVFIFVVLTFAFGPAVGLVIYGVVALLRQDANPAVLGCFAVAALSRIVCELSAGGLSFSQLMPFSSLTFDINAMAITWSAFAALAGWYMANVFHKFDE